jgi:hypothetical protein
MKISVKTKSGVPIMLISLLITGMLFSCKEPGTVDIKVSKLNNYPLFGIKNANGSDVTFQPVSEDTGSIGFELENETFWFTGKPDKTVKEDKSVKYLWDIKDGINAELEVINTTDEVEFKLSLISKDNQKKPSKWFINTKATEDEYFTGALERVVDGDQNKSWSKDLKTALNLRNEKVEMKVKSTVAAYSPFYLSSNNYGLYVKGTWPGIFDFCKTNPGIVQVAFEGPEMLFKL